MATHEELVSEMPLLEKLTIQERLKHAKKRRNQQLKRYQQYERDFQRKTKKLNSQKSDTSVMSEGGTTRVCFAANVQLLEAAARGDTVEVEAFLKAGVDPNTGNEDGLTALHQSCIDNREDMLKVLLDNGADVNIKDREMWTPLHAAATCGHKNLAAHLISRGADLLAINSDGNMPYDICEDEETLDYIETQMAAQGITQDQIDDLREVAPSKMLEDMKKIAEAGGSLESRDETGATPLHIAVAQGFEKVVVFLLESKVDIHAVDNDGWQPIHAAACWAQAEIIQILVEHGADLDSRTNNNETPLMICEEDEIKSLIHQLKTESLKNQRHNLVRRGSSRKNRGSSIRRSSKRDKGEMRKMDAKGEAAFIQSQEIPATNIDDVITNGSSEEPQSNGQSDSKEPATPDHVMTDEQLPEIRLSHLSTESNEEPESPSEPMNEVSGEMANHSAVIETKRPKSILKKTSSRIETDLDPSKKLNKDDRKSEKKSALDRNQSQELKQKEKEQKEKERQRLKEEKEKKKQREKEEKQKKREEQVQKKQKEKDEKIKKDAQQTNEDQIVMDQDGVAVGDALSEEEKYALENNGSGPDTLPELKRQRQQMNSPIHSSAGSPSLSASSDKSSDNQQTDKQNGGSGEGKSRGVGNNKSSSRFSARFPFSLPFMQSYDLQDKSSNYNEQKRDSVAMNEPAVISDVMPGESDNRTAISVETEDEPLKKFTANQNSDDFPEDGATETCCKMM